MTLAYLAVVAALAGIQTTQKQLKPTVVAVRIVIAPRATLEEQCKAGKFTAVDVLVDSDPKFNEPYHCPPGGKLLEHKNAHADKRTLVQISYMNQDSVQWSSDTEFTISSITPRDPKVKEGTPQTPFGKMSLSLKPTKSINSGPITSKAAVGYQYKVVFTIGKRIIDPDVWCNP